MKWIHSHAQKYEGKLYDLDYFLAFNYPGQRHLRYFLLDYRRNEAGIFRFENINLFRWTLFAVCVDMVCNITRVIIESMEGNLREAQSVAAVFSMEIYFTVRGFSLIPIRTELADVLNKLDKMLPRSKAKQREMHVPELAKQLEKRFCYLHGYVYAAKILFIMVPLVSYFIFYDGTGPLLDEYVQNPSWLPFGLKHNPKYYYFVYIWSTYLTIAGIFHAASHDHIFTVVITQLIMHFEYLVKCVKELDAADTLQGDKSDEFWIKFKEYLKYKNTLDSLSRDINNIFNTSIFCSDMICSASICFQVYLVANTDDILLLVTFGMPCLVLTWCTYDFSNRGEDLQKVSGEIEQAFYHSNWYEGSQYYQKQMILCLQCSSKPCKLTALHMFDVNMEHFRKMMSLAYQMFAFLQSR